MGYIIGGTKIMIKHTHHIIPRHAGGTDDPSNLVELTIAEHAEAHRILYEKHGRPEDKLAWQCLAGLLTKEEIMHEICSLAGKKGGAIGGKAGKGRKQSKQHIALRASKVTGELNGMYGKQLTQEQKQKQSVGILNHINNLQSNEEWQGTLNLIQSAKKRLADGTHPSKMKWQCVCGKSGVGKSNFIRWHSKCSTIEQL
jgi:hypothetical protein